MRIHVLERRLIGVRKPALSLVNTAAGLHDHLGTAHDVQHVQLLNKGPDIQGGKQAGPSLLYQRQIFFRKVPAVVLSGEDTDAARKVIGVRVRIGNAVLCQHIADRIGMGLLRLRTDGGEGGSVRIEGRHGQINIPGELFLLAHKNEVRCFTRVQNTGQGGERQPKAEHYENHCTCQRQQFHDNPPFIVFLSTPCVSLLSAAVPADNGLGLLRDSLPG